MKPPCVSHALRISGKTFEWTENPEERRTAWSFETRPGGWILATHPINGKRKRLFLSMTPSAQELQVQLEGCLWEGKWQEARPKETVSPQPSQQGALFQNKRHFEEEASFPGRVRKVLVRPGDTVRQGQRLFLLEAMKMEFSIQAPQPGIIQHIWVEEGSCVAGGEKLYTLELKSGTE